MDVGQPEIIRVAASGLLVTREESRERPRIACEGGHFSLVADKTGTCTGRFQVGAIPVPGVDAVYIGLSTRAVRIQRFRLLSPRDQSQLRNSVLEQCGGRRSVLPARSLMRAPTRRQRRP